jgi:class 3 adenylate cyclase
MTHRDPPAQPGAEADSPSARIAKLRHDLRTPLNHIIGYTEILEEDAPADLFPDLQRIRTAAYQLLRGMDEALGVVGQLLEDRGPPAVPRLTAAPDEEAGRQAKVAPAEAGASLLVVDDNEANRDVLARRLALYGFSVDLAEDGQVALEMIERGDYDLVLLDIMMPRLNGIEVVRRLRETRSMSELPVIMTTAKDGSDDVVEALKQGANDYVTKPINLPVLIARSQTQLELRHAHRRIRNLASQLEARNRFIRETFGRYLTDEVVESLLETPGGLSLGGEARTVTILMSDIRGFSGLSERLPPGEVISLLNHFLGTMTEIICRRGGTIDEFIGDAILVIFGAPTARPDDALRAVACAAEMQLAMAAVNERGRTLGLPRIEMGIGINTGDAVVGNIGSERRAKYGVVGRNVNLASRIQGFAVGGQVLVSGTTLRAAGDTLRVNGSVEVFPKGSIEPLRIYEIGGVGGDYALELPQHTAELVLLREPVPVRFAVVDGVNAPAPGIPGTITHLSPRRARLTAHVPLSAMSTVKLELQVDDRLRPGQVYARVVATEDGGHRVIVHFTTVSPEIEGYVEEILTKGP